MEKREIIEAELRTQAKSMRSDLETAGDAGAMEKAQEWLAGELEKLDEKIRDD